MNINRNGSVIPDLRKHWFNSEINSFRGVYEDVRKIIPDFDRRGFTLYPESVAELANKRLDMIIRRPVGNDTREIPLGVVSKDYVLLPHLTVLDAAVKILSKHGIAPEELEIELTLTEY